MHERTDQELIEEVLKHSSDSAFRLLVERHQSLVVRTCKGFVTSYADAQDIAQEVFIEMFQSLPNFKGQSKLSTWLYRISVNKSLNFIRKQNRERMFRRIECFFGRSNSTNDCLEVPDTSALIADRMEAEQTRMEVRRAIDALPENQRIAFVLSRYQELSYKEIAGVMGMSVTSVESLIFRAKRNLMGRFMGKK